MKVSAIIPAFNEEKLITRGVNYVRDSLTAFTGRGWETEIIVCNNNSTDRTAELAAAAGATVVFEPINQIAGARNRGVAAATGDWLIITDADTMATKELYADTEQAMASEIYLFGGCTFRLDRKQSVGEFSAKLWNAYARMVTCAGGPFIFAETRAFREIGGFDTTLFAAEDVDFSRRMRQLARRNGKRGIILTAHPLTVSDRKLQLYSGREYLRFLGRVMVSRRRTFTSREACHIWYDGRR